MSWKGSVRIFVIHDSPTDAPMYDDDCVHLQFDGDREVDPQAVHIGMQVKAIWKPSAERTGAITDILYFKPVS